MRRTLQSTRQNGGMPAKTTGIAVSAHIWPGAPALFRQGRKQPAAPAWDTGKASGPAWAAIGALVGGGLAALLAAGSSALAVYFARRVITPVRIRVEDQEVLAVIRDGTQRSVILAATPDTTVDGVFSLFFNGGTGHARIGRILSYSPAEGTVQRVVEEVYEGDLEAARRGWWSGAVYSGPSDAGLPYEDVKIAVEVGEAPAWFVPAPEADAPVWAIMVHGRGSNRLEGLRAVRTARALGLPSLLISYRNDGVAPSAPDGRYGLGGTEWRDVEAAIEYALERGAREVVLFGWSMGGAICLQTADLSRHRHLIRALVLDAPVLNWVNVLAHHARINRIPYAVGRYGQLMLGHALGRRLTGLAAPVDFKALDWEVRAVELRTPTLILHSIDDDYVPYGPSASVAAKNPEMVTFEPFHGARHTKEWNVSPEKWEGVVSAWLSRQLAPRRNPGGDHPEATMPA